MMIRRKYLPKFVYTFLRDKVFVKNGRRAKIKFSWDWPFVARYNYF